MTRHAATILVDLALNAQSDLDTFVRTYRGVDILSDSNYRARLTDRDNAREAVIAALVGGGS